MQETSIEAGAFQCGFLTPGFVTKELLDDIHDPSDDEIRHRTGNLRRWRAYPQILAAVRFAVRRRGV